MTWRKPASSPGSDRPHAAFDLRRRLELGGHAFSGREDFLRPPLRLGGRGSIAAIASARDLAIQGDVVALSGDSGWKNMEKLAQI